MSQNTRRGRPANPNATRVIRVDAETKTICGPGRPNPSKNYLELTILKSNLNNFYYGKTPVINEVKINAIANSAKQTIDVQVTIPESPAMSNKDF